MKVKSSIILKEVTFPDPLDFLCNFSVLRLNQRAFKGVLHFERTDDGSVMAIFGFSDADHELMDLDFIPDEQVRKDIYKRSPA